MIKRLIAMIECAVIAGMLVCVSPLVDEAGAQWQVPNYSIPVGRGAGTGFKSVGPCVDGGAPVWSSISTDPACSTASGSTLLVGTSSANYTYTGSTTLTNQAVIHSETSDVLGLTGVTNSLLNFGVANSAGTIFRFGYIGAFPLVTTAGSETGDVVIAAPVAGGNATDLAHFNTTGLGLGTSTVTPHLLRVYKIAGAGERMTASQLYGESSTSGTPSEFDYMQYVYADQKVNANQTFAFHAGHYDTISRNIATSEMAGIFVQMQTLNAPGTASVNTNYAIDTNNYIPTGQNRANSFNFECVITDQSTPVSGTVMGCLRVALSAGATDKAIEIKGAGGGTVGNIIDYVEAGTQPTKVIAGGSFTATYDAAGHTFSGGAVTISTGGLKLAGSTSGTITLLAANTAGTNSIKFPAGTVDFSATGGTSQVIKQTSAGGAFTVAQLACADLSDSTSACSTSLGTGVATWLTTPSSANLAAALTDETGSGAAVFATTPTLVTPVLGVASATSINKVALTAPATGSTLTIADGKTLTASNTLTFAGTDGSTLNIGTGGTLGTAAFKNTGTSGNNVPLLDGTNTWSGDQSISQKRLTMTGAQTLSVSQTSLFTTDSSSITLSADRTSAIQIISQFTGTAGGAGNQMVGLDVNPAFIPTASINAARGSLYVVTCAPGSTVTIANCEALNLIPVYADTAGAITTSRTIMIQTPFAIGSLKPTTHYGIHLLNQGLSGVTTSYALKIDAQSASTTSYGLYTDESITFGAAAKTVVLKQGANGSVGTFTCVSASNVTVNNTFVAASDAIVISYSSGTAATPGPYINALTASTSFQVACSSGDTAVYNYAIIKNAAWLLERDLNPAANDNSPIFMENVA